VQIILELHSVEFYPSKLLIATDHTKSHYSNISTDKHLRHLAEMGETSGVFVQQNYPAFHKICAPNVLIN